MKHDIPEPPKQHNDVKIRGKYKQPSDRDISVFMELIQQIVQRSRDDESRRLHQSING